MLIRKSCSTNPAFGKRPEQRTVQELLNLGMINLNKPAGPTSSQTLDYVKRLLGIKKAGYSGTLDPAATGVLPIALGRGTKVLAALAGIPKEYIALAHFHKPISESTLKAAMERFRGKIVQLPPVRSAVKRVPRTREIYSFELLELEQRSGLFRIGCEAGTYVRKLIHDLGKELGGAHLVQLVRSKAGPFELSSSVNMYQLERAAELFKKGESSELRKAILPIEAGAEGLARIVIEDSAVAAIAHGQPLKAEGICSVQKGIKPGQLVALFSLKDELVAFAEAVLCSEEMLRAAALAARPWKVIMPAGVYKFINQRG